MDNIFNPPKKSVVFKLYTKENTAGEVLNENDDAGLNKSSINFARPTKIVTHGYRNGADSPACILIRNGKPSFLFQVMNDKKILTILTKKKFSLSEYW